MSGVLTALLRPPVEVTQLDIENGSLDRVEPRVETDQIMVIAWAFNRTENRGGFATNPGGDTSGRGGWRGNLVPEGR